VLTGPLVPPTWHPPATERELRQTLAHIRLSGYATTPVRQEYRSVAAPIHGPAGPGMAALSLILPIAEPYGPRLAHPAGHSAGDLPRPWQQRLGPSLVNPRTQLNRALESCPPAT
jgi:DNA-binding IclR family transcriptional regulator